MTRDILLEVKNVTRRFGARYSKLDVILGRARPGTVAVSKVSFSVERGKTFALVGESGSGKSTLGRMLAGLLEPSEGEIHFDNVLLNAETLRKRALRRRVQMIFQDPYASLNPRLPVWSIVSEPLAINEPKIRSDELRARAIELLLKVGLNADDAGKYPHQFSGGQRQRISISRALATEPDFLICDEPTSALDVSVQAQILNLMKDLQAELGLTLMLITHNLAVVRYMADAVGVMQGGELVELSDSASFFAQPQTVYARALLAAVPSIDRFATGAHVLPFPTASPAMNSG